MTQQDNNRRAIVYIDGLNLYYGAVKKTSYKWLDLEQLCQRLLPEYDLNGIKYFTSIVIDAEGNPGTSQRQNVYLRALKTLPNVSVYEGKMKKRKRWRRLVYPSLGGPTNLLIYETQEKETDVNLASHLLCDAFLEPCDLAVVITNDSDIAPAIRMVEEKAKVKVLIVNPNRHGRRARGLKASSYDQINEGILASSQLPNRLEDGKGSFHKPPEW